MREIWSDHSNDEKENIYIYTNLKNNQKYYISQNKEDIDEVTVCEKQGEVIPYGALSQIEIYGKVAAGTLQQAYEEVLGGFVLPYIPSNQEHFILQVDGKSMINAGIYPGDYIVVKKQNYADNMNIVVAVIEEDATLKKFLRKGSDITLLPENNEYESITVREEELQINGVVVGVISRSFTKGEK